MLATTEVAVEIVKICRECNAWKELNENIILIVKRRAQIKQVFEAVFGVRTRFTLFSRLS